MSDQANPPTFPVAATGASSTLSRPSQSDSCCGGPASAGADACCVLDATAKATGEDGCGCSDKAESRPQEDAACCGPAA